MLSFSVPDSTPNKNDVRRSRPVVEHTPDNLPPINERFDNLLIAPARVSQMMGRRSPGEVAFAQSEQGDARRRLLHVEKVAIKNKQLQAQSEASLLDRVNAELHQYVFELLKDEIDNTEVVLTSVLNLSHDIAPLLDILSVRATSISRIEPHAAALPWLYDDLMSVVNAPKFRRKDSKGKVIPVETLRTALSFIGIENLRLLLPAMILRRALPKITDPYPDIKNRIMQFAQSTGLTMRALADDYDLPPHEAFTAGILSQLGRCAVSRLYFKAFEQAQIALLREAEIAKDTEQHGAMAKVQPSANYLIAMQQEFSEPLTARLLEILQFKRLRLALPFIEITENDQHPHDLTELYKKAKAYAAVRMLHQGKFLNKDEIPLALHKTGFVRSERDILKSTDIFQLPLIENPPLD